jgi:hypothetical protein
LYLLEIAEKLKKSLRMYTLLCTLIQVKRRDLERQLKDLGWWEISGAKHGKWTNGTQVTMVPRHSEVVEWTARGIIKFAKQNLGSGAKKK